MIRKFKNLRLLGRISKQIFKDTISLIYLFSQQIFTKWLLLRPLRDSWMAQLFFLKNETKNEQIEIQKYYF